MDIQIFKYKFRIEILILILVLWWILFGHTFCSCSNVGLMEGFTTIAKKVKKEGMRGALNYAMYNK